MHRIVCILLLACTILSGVARAEIAPAEARALAMNAVETLVYFNHEMASNYFRSGEWDLSIAAMDRVIELDYHDVESYSSAAWLLWSQKKHTEAMDYYQRMIAANPLEPQGHFDIGYYYYINLENYAAACPWLERAVELGMPSPMRHLYGHCLKRLGRTDDALAFWRKVLADDPDNTIAQNHVAELSGEIPAPTPEDE